jgi:hypothetical protein
MIDDNKHEVPIIKLPSGVKRPKEERDADLKLLMDAAGVSLPPAPEKDEDKR